MSDITEGIDFEVKNIISYRNGIKKRDIYRVINDISKIASENDTILTGKPMITLLSVDVSDKDPDMYVEIIVPVEHEIEVSDAYKFSSLFRIENAVKLDIRDKEEHPDESKQRLIKYLSERNLIPLTSVYSVIQMDSENNNGKVVEMLVGIMDEKT